ncbi:twitching motility protein PilT [Candidatus Kryptonium thompsonii]|jgi:twitching motility protein PilT|uniref:Twitching motility protein PilT n=1 Tax=Candidatus Kryptonium thompsonii TaxID=1633631 RepID=A0A0P1LPV3_9BACT|nr:PilT/PilU family type 4a pilus ATPase [Candidatus Kryptonium thompsoni]CUS77733.1 twitching motility protein PilT [Candidatus Kryptonium thompsoni]CUS79399.1 twitching motility protein PilT [Candidatus Kryptonium thompsoni]CUS81601.1 twitching motility protein PilT [Candidatus Kryptonium thompsoni]CUS83628.1 twitching motility protein PilT [Candidatus Kryptonium thompsoni]CUS86762.1 twitching motility protein PilT [Candidatus Kryptonium thompsoni]
MPVNPQLVKEAKELLSSLAKKIPVTLFSIEKQMYIGNEIIKKMPEEQKLLLRNLINMFLIRMREVEASDIDLGGWGSKKMVWLRIHGVKKPIPEFGVYELDEFNILIQSLLMERQREYLYENRNLDFSYTLKDENGVIYRYRADAYFDLDDLALNMRAINTQIRPYESYGFHPNVTRMLSLQYTKEGLILVTGITGSGKSTTLDAIVDLNNRTVDAHIIIIASPIEYVHESKRCIIRHREVGRDTMSFKQGTIEALRQDPDIIIIGEMRDPDTIMAALEVADSGHKVLSTLHTSSAVESIDRIIGEVPPIEQERVRNRLADILRCVISQKLVPSLDGKRVLAKEVMVMTPSIRAAIKNNNTGEIYQMIAEGAEYGMITMEQDLRRLYLERKISLETAMNFANNKRRMQQLLQAA